MAATRIDPRSGLFVFTDVAAGESGWRDQFVDNMERLALTRPAPVIDRDLTAPPGSPSDFDVYIVAGTATGAWAGHEGELAVWDDEEEAWVFYEPAAGWLAVIIDESRLAMYTGSAWTSGTDLAPT